MKLLLRRDQKPKMGRVYFTLAVRSELTDTERDNIGKYNLGYTMLYERKVITDRGSGLLGAASRLAFKMANLSVSVNDLAAGKIIECHDIVEMLAIEDQIKEAAQTLKNVLDAAASFGGEIVVEVA